MAKSRSGFDQRVKYDLEIEGQPADDFEHVGGRRLLLQRFPQLVGRPRVLDGDDRPWRPSVSPLGGRREHDPADDLRSPPDIGQSPLDVVAWHGNYAPYKYDLRRFSPVGALRADCCEP